jgi:hypothetical protein
MDVNLSAFFPSQAGISFLKSKKGTLFIQQRHDLQKFPIDDQFVWRADNLLYGGMFGGDAQTVSKIGKQIEIAFQEKMLANRNVNNEQLAFSIIWKDNPELFTTIIHQHIIIFKHLSL